MRAILGIDAAWTATEPSGVALICEHGAGWRCAAVAPSYAAFLGLAESRPVAWGARHRGSEPDPAALLGAARALAGCAVAVVAVDMPLAVAPFTTRRPSDRLVSRAFARAKCATHSPTAERPGPLGRRLSEGFARAGVPLATAATPAGTPGRLLEVYPHPALLALLGLPERLQYKVSRSGRYWPGLAPAERIPPLLAAYRRILAALGPEIGAADLPIPPDGSVAALAALKQYEDAADALVCAWVGARYLAGRAAAYGDDDSAIWIP